MQIIEQIIQSLTMPTETFAFIKEEPEAKKETEDIESFITSEPTPTPKPAPPAAKKETIPKAEKTKIDTETPIETEKIGRL